MYAIKRLQKYFGFLEGKGYRRVVDDLLPPKHVKYIRQNVHIPCTVAVYYEKEERTFSLRISHGERVLFHNACSCTIYAHNLFNVEELLYCFDKMRTKKCRFRKPYGTDQLMRLYRDFVSSNVLSMNHDQMTCRDDSVRYHTSSRHDVNIVLSSFIYLERWNYAFRYTNFHEHERSFEFTKESMVISIFCEGGTSNFSVVKSGTILLQIYEGELIEGAINISKFQECVARQKNASNANSSNCFAETVNAYANLLFENLYILGI